MWPVLSKAPCHLGVLQKLRGQAHIAPLRRLRSKRCNCDIRSYFKPSKFALKPMGPLQQKPLLEIEIPEDDPAPLFRQWVQDARDFNISLPMTANLATAALPSGEVTSRQVQITDFDNQQRFTLYSNWGKTQKGEAFRNNNLVALSFYWKELDRAVRVEGAGVRMTQEEDSDYFQTRSREYQVSVVASKQDEIASSRQEIEALMRATASITGEDILHPPPEWGGVRIVPQRFEFWQGREDLIHDRIVYKLEGSKWLRARLYP